MPAFPVRSRASTPGLPALLRLAWPMIVSRSTQAVVGLADALMVAHLGGTALAAVTTGALNGFALLIFPMGVAFIVASFSSQLAGRRDFAAARRFGWYGLGIAAAAQVVALVTIPAIGPVLGVLDYEPGVAEALGAYLAVRLLFTGPAVGIEALGNYYAGLGNTGILMRANLAAMAMNLAFNWLLIDGHLGFPAMGVRGAALASVLATSLAFLGFLAAFLAHGRGLLRSRLRLSEFGRLLRFGLPSGMNWAFEFFAFVAFVNVVVAGLGTERLAAMMTVLQVNAISFMPAFGLGSAGAILIGQAIGARRPGRVPALARLTLRTAAAWQGAVGVAYWLAPALLLAPFASGAGPGGTFMAVGVRMLMLSAFWQLFDAAGITYSEALRAAGDTSYAMWARGILAWGIFLPGSWISVRLLGGGAGAAMAWLLVYLALLALVLYTRFRAGAWRRIRLVGPHPPA